MCKKIYTVVYGLKMYKNTVPLKKFNYKMKELVVAILRIILLESIKLKNFRMYTIHLSLIKYTRLYFQLSWKPCEFNFMNKVINLLKYYVVDNQNNFPA